MPPASYTFKLLLLLLSLAPHSIFADECDWAPDPLAKPNLYPIDDGSLLRLNRTVPNGKAYLGGQPGFEFFVAHLYGSDYEMGEAQGLLFKNEIGEFMREMWGWLEAQVEDDFPKGWPAWFSDMVAELGLDVALDALVSADAPYIGQNIHDELAGVAAGSGVDAALIRRLQLIAELTQGQCTLALANQQATVGGHTLFMRGFDWNAGCPCRSWPVITVYHPDAARGGSGNAWLNVGWAGWVGSFTALSSKVGGPVTVLLESRESVVSRCDPRVKTAQVYLDLLSRFSPPPTHH